MYLLVKVKSEQDCKENIFETFRNVQMSDFQQHEHVTLRNILSQSEKFWIKNPWIEIQ